MSSLRRGSRVYSKQLGFAGVIRSVYKDGSILVEWDEPITFHLASGTIERLPHTCEWDSTIISERDMVTQRLTE